MYAHTAHTLRSETLCWASSSGLREMRDKISRSVCFFVKTYIRYRRRRTRGGGEMG